ncbi:hypothetical protein [Candidatus Binatus sp.]
MLPEDGIDLLDKKPSRRPIVEDWHQNREQGREFCAETSTVWTETRRR